MNNTINFKTFDFIQGMSIEITEELADLEEDIKKNDAKVVRIQYNHLSSLLKGIFTRRGSSETINSVASAFPPASL